MDRINPTIEIGNVWLREINGVGQEKRIKRIFEIQKRRVDSKSKNPCKRE